jgi:hypothetical protein
MWGGEQGLLRVNDMVVQHLSKRKKKPGPHVTSVLFYPYIRSLLPLYWVSFDTVAYLRSTTQPPPLPLMLILASSNPAKTLSRYPLLAFVSPPPPPFFLKPSPKP